MSIFQKLAFGLAVCWGATAYGAEGDLSANDPQEFAQPSVIPQNNIVMHPDIEIPIPPLDPNGRQVVQTKLNDRWFYEKIEYHWWNISACCCRISGAAFESAGLLAFFVANGAIPVIAVSGLTDQEKIIGAVIIAGVNYLVIAGPKMVRYAFQMGGEREKFAKDIAETGGIRDNSLNTPTYPPV